MKKESINKKTQRSREPLGYEKTLPRPDLGLLHPLATWNVTVQSGQGSAMEAAGIEPASRDGFKKNVYMRSPLLLTLQAKPADYRRQVGYHHRWLSIQPVRRLSVGQRDGR
jgi:hypothetical protein